MATLMSVTDYLLRLVLVSNQLAICAKNPMKELAYESVTPSHLAARTFAQMCRWIRLSTRVLC